MVIDCDTAVNLILPKIEYGTSWFYQIVIGANRGSYKSYT
jgi:hypothetical protein